MQKLIHYTVVGYIALLMFVKMFAMPLVCLEYTVNRDYISSVLCENKARPQIECNGQCHLRKQLNKTGETPDTPAQKNTVKSITIDYFEDHNMFVFRSYTTGKSSYNGIGYQYVVSGFRTDVFHPPLV